MGVQVFTESEVRASIIKKAPVYDNSGKRSPHSFAFLKHKDVHIDHFRIPNDHNKKEFKQGKGNHMAKKLRLTHQQYNDFIHCRMKEEEYLKILDTVVDNMKKQKSAE